MAGPLLRGIGQNPQVVEIVSDFSMVYAFVPFFLNVRSCCEQAAIAMGEISSIMWIGLIDLIVGGARQSGLTLKGRGTKNHRLKDRIVEKA